MKKFIATVSAVVLSFAMVALPAVSASADNDNTCQKVGYTKLPDGASGTYSDVFGTLNWSNGQINYALNPGYTLDLCIHSGSKTGDPATPQISQFYGVTGTGTVTEAHEDQIQDISHIGFKVTSTPPTPINVAVTGAPTGEVCDSESGDVTPGSILVAIAPSGGATVEYRKQGDVAWIPLGANPITGLAGGTYEFQVTAASGYTLTTPSTFTVVVPSDTSEACDDVVPTNVAVTATPTGEVCDAESRVPTPGSILVGIAPSGGATVEYRKQGDVTWIPLGANPITGLAGGTYEFKVTAATGHVLTTPSTFTVVVPSKNPVDCIQLEDHPLVTPQASQDPGCELPSFFTIGNDLSDPAALTWTANGQPIAEGTHVVTAGTTIQLIAATSGPEYGFAKGAQTEWTFKFPQNETCGDLKTLALTGATDTTPVLALTAFLGLLGLAMVRSGMRVNRNNRQEA